MPTINPPGTVIKNIVQLRDYLQVALKLEHATIPPYLTAAYSAKVEANKPSIDIIRVVAKEEMLHLTLVANLLNAIGGKPDLIAPDFVPLYPKPLPTGQTGFDVNIEKFSHHAIESFLKIERPDPPNPEEEGLVRYEKTIALDGKHIDPSLRESDNPFIPVTKVGDDKYELHYHLAFIPHHKLSAERLEMAKSPFLPTLAAQDAGGNDIQLHYYSIGQFYKAISLGFVELSQSKDVGVKALFTGDPRFQVGSKYFYSAGGEAIEVTDLKSAISAIDLIAGQGEGSRSRIYDDQNELAHYYRFDQIIKGQYYRVPDDYGNNGDVAGKPKGGKFPVDMDAVFPIRANIKIEAYKDHPQLEEYALLFNGQYKRFLAKLNAAFNGRPDLLGAVFAAEMFQIKVAMERLIRNPIPGTKENAAPTFEMNLFKYPPNAPGPAAAI